MAELSSGLESVWAAADTSGRRSAADAGVGGRALVRRLRLGWVLECAVGPVGWGASAGWDRGVLNTEKSKLELCRSGSAAPALLPVPHPCPGLAWEHMLQ